MPRPPGFTPLTLATIAFALSMQLVSVAQDVTEPALKAAYIYNFARFTEWPPDLPASEPFVMCVLGDPAVSEALERVVKGRQLAGRSMTVSPLSASDSTRGCHVLYVSSAMADKAGPLVAGLHDAPILTIGDAADFIRTGGIARFFFERGQLRFSINRQAVKRARLQISSRLLALAERYEGS